MKIKSITYVITNSSSEVYCYKLDDPRYQKAKKLNYLIWTEFRTEEDIKKFILENPCDLILTSSSSCQWNHGPENLDVQNIFDDHFCLIEDLKKVKSDDEIWEFFKDFYKDLLGKAYCVFCNEGVSSEVLDEIHSLDDEI